MLQPIELVSRAVVAISEVLGSRNNFAEDEIQEWYATSCKNVGIIPSATIREFVAGSYSSVDHMALNLAGYDATDLDVAIAIAAAFFSPATISDINLSSSGIGPISTQVLVAALDNSRLSMMATLSLRGNDIGDRTIASIVRGLPAAPLLERLDLASTSATGSGLTVFLDVGAGTLPSLSTLVLDMNPLGSVGGRVLARILQVHPIRQMYIGSCGLGDAGAVALSVGLPGSTLEEVYLWENEIGDDGAVALGQALGGLPKPQAPAPPRPTSITMPVQTSTGSTGFGPALIGPRRVATPATPSMTRPGFRSTGPTRQPTPNPYPCPAPPATGKGASIDANANDHNDPQNDDDITTSDNEEQPKGPTPDQPPATALRVVALWNNSIKNIGAGALAESLAAPAASALTSLDLSGNPLGDAGITAMSPYLGTVIASQRDAAIAAIDGLDVPTPRRPLATLDLASTGVTARGAGPLIAALHRSNTDRPPLTTLPPDLTWTTLTSVNLHGNNLQDAGIIKLMSGIRACVSLSRLTLSQTMLSHAGVAAVAALLTVRPTVRHLDLSCNRLTDEAMSVLVRRVRTVRLETIVLDHNELGDTSATALAEAVVDHPTLTHLSLAHNRCGLVAAVALEQALERYPGLQLLNVSGNPIPDHAQTALCHAVAKLWVRQRNAGIPALTCDLVHEMGFEPEAEA